jgi:signal recognition particle subunit SRP54
MKGSEIDNSAFIRIEAMVSSMTLKERENPKILNGSRRQRIAKGSGTSVQDVNKLIKQFEELQKVMKSLAFGKKSKIYQNLEKWGIR